MSCAAAKNVSTLYGLRFIIGLLEASAYPSLIWLLGSWYGPQELGKRVILLQSSSSAAYMFSGYLQTAVHSGLNGRGGLAGWAWLFIMDGWVIVASFENIAYLQCHLPTNRHRGLLLHPRLPRQDQPSISLVFQQARPRDRARAYRAFQPHSCSRIQPRRLQGHLLHLAPGASRNPAQELQLTRSTPSSSPTPAKSLDSARTPT